MFFRKFERELLEAVDGAYPMRSDSYYLNPDDETLDIEAQERAPLFDGLPRFQVAQTAIASALVRKTLSPLQKKPL